MAEYILVKNLENGVVLLRWMLFRVFTANVTGFRRRPNQQNPATCVDLDNGG